MIGARASLATRRRAARAAGLGLALLTLAGCSVGPDYKTPTLTLPALFDGAEETVVASAKAPDLGRWWTRLGDPTLDALIDSAMRRNLDVATAQASLREARAVYRQAGGALSPSVDASAGAQRSGTADGDHDTQARFSGGLDASWELDLFGANRRAVEAAWYGVGASEAQLRDVRLILIGDVASYYVDARSLQQRLRLSRRTAVTQRETAELTRVQLESGAASGLDDASARAQLLNTEADIPSLQLSLAETVNRLSVLTGLSPAAVREQLGDRGAIPTPKLPLPAGAPAQSLLGRPDIRAAERALAQATARIGEAEAARYPSVSLTGSLGTSAANIADLGKDVSISWAFGPSISLPIFSGGRLEAAADAARAARDQAYLGLHQTVLTALEEVENALYGLARERERYAKLRAATRARREAAQLARDLYRAGGSSLLDVLDAERSLYSSEASLIQSQAALATYYIALNKALGGGWDGAVDAGQPTLNDDNGPRLAFMRKEI